MVVEPRDVVKNDSQKSSLTSRISHFSLRMNLGFVRHHGQLRGHEQVALLARDPTALHLLGVLLPGVILVRL